MSRPGRKERVNTPWTALVPLVEGDAPELPRLLAEVRAQSVAPAQIVVVDATFDGLGDTHPRPANFGGTSLTILRELSPSRGLAWQRAAGATKSPWIAVFAPRSSYRRERVEQQLAAIIARPGARIVTSDLSVERQEGTSYRIVQDLTPDPTGAFEDSFLLHRDAARRVDGTCFSPAELSLLRRERAAGTVSHVSAALHRVAEDDYIAACVRTREDSELLALGFLPQTHHSSNSPEVTVLLATHERRGVLLECLEGFSRQLIPAGTLEIVVVDDASGDGTRELGEALELSVPLHFAHLETPGGATQARIHGLPHARGELVLFVNDDTIPFPDTVRRHIEAQRELADEKAIVLGTFEQPEEHRELALTRLLDESSYIFDYASWEPGKVLAGTAFYTCNLSVSRQAVLDAGGFDASFSMYAEDTDLGIRLEQAGYAIHYRPECRAIHRHLFDFEMLRRRQPLVAKAHVKLFAKHRALLAGTRWAELDRNGVKQVLDPIEGFLPTLEAAARTLSGIRVGRMESAGGGLSNLSRRITTRLTEIVSHLNTVWWYRGFQEGFEEQGGRGLRDLVATWTPGTTGGETPTHILRPAGEHWIRVVEAWVERELTRSETPRDADDSQVAPPALLLLADAHCGWTRETLCRALGPIVRRARCAGLAAPIALSIASDEASRRARLRHAQAWIPTGAEEDTRDSALAAEVGCPRLELPRECSFGPGSASLRILAWPEWHAGDSLSQLAQVLTPLADRPGAEVLLLANTEDGVEGALGLDHLRTLLRPQIPGASPPALRIVPVPATDGAWFRLARSVDLTIYSPELDHDSDRLLETLERPHVNSAAELQERLSDLDSAAPTLVSHPQTQATSHA